VCLTKTFCWNPLLCSPGVAAQSSSEDGSLQLLLDALLEVAVLNKADARVLSEALAEPTTVSGLAYGVTLNQGVDLDAHLRSRLTPFLHVHATVHNAQLHVRNSYYRYIVRHTCASSSTT
jgi:hypothetical protein